MDFVEQHQQPIIKAAEEELESLLKIQADLDQKRAENVKRISAVVRAIENLRDVYGIKPEKTLTEQLTESYQQQLGLTDQIREILESRHPNWLPPTVVKAYLEQRGFRVAEYANPMAVVHQVLRRLDEQGWAESEPLTDGGKVYRVKRIPLRKGAFKSAKVESMKDVQ